MFFFTLAIFYSFLTAIMVVSYEEIDYNKHCAFSIGEYVQASEDVDPKNNNHPRTLDCIYLRPNSHSKTGAHELLHIPTGKVITRPKATKIPITQSVIDAVHALADKDCAPKGLKIATRNKTILWDSTWSAGVDYDPETFEPIEETDEEDDEEEDDDNMPELYDNDDDSSVDSDDDDDDDEDFDDEDFVDLKQTPIYRPRPGNHPTVAFDGVEIMCLI